MIKQRQAGLWPRTLLWLVGLSVFFFSSYGLVNWLTSLRSDVGSLVFSWEPQIPLWSWTIVPYWSIDLFYGLAILLASTKTALDTLGRRLLTAQLLCLSGFLLYPLQFTFYRSPQTGFWGFWFDLLMGFDKPFNQAPSLHITLLVILWRFYAARITGRWRWLLHSWFSLIGLSVLTTWQHHFFDVPTGIIAGCLVIWLWPQQGKSPLCFFSIQGEWKIGGGYFLAALLLSGLALYWGGFALWLLWPAMSLLLVALNYLFLGAQGFQKQSNGQYQLPITLLYAPYIAIMWLNSRLWTRNTPRVSLIGENIYLGRIPDSKTLAQENFSAVVDLCAELPFRPYHGRYHLIATLDMTATSVEFCQQAALTIEQEIKTYPEQKVLVSCALGYSRSAIAVIAWLLATHRVTNVAAAIDRVKQARPQIVISRAQQVVLQNWLQQISERCDAE